MKKCYHKIDKRNRKTMTDYLQGHFRYNTMNSWNHSTSYAHNLKIHTLGLTAEQSAALMVMMDCSDAYETVDNLIWTFGYQHDWQWQAAFNGRSGGYLVLYQGGQKPSEWKSYCTVCGQRNYKTVEESGCRCGRCGNETRRNFSTPPTDIFTYSGRNTDMDEDFTDWTMDDLRERVRLVEEFDRLCDKIIAEAMYISEHFKVEEETYTVEAKRKVLTERKGGAE